MIFLVIIGVVAAFVLMLVYIDSSNVKKIEDFLMHQKCKTIDYTKGSYQAICSDKVIVIENGFSIDLSKAKMVYYKTLKDIEVQEKSLLLKSNQNIPLTFKDESSKELFLKKLEEKREK